MPCEHDGRGEQMKRFIEGENRQQVTLMPDVLDDYVGEDNPVRVVDLFVDELDLIELGFEDAVPATTGRLQRANGGRCPAPFAQREHSASIPDPEPATAPAASGQNTAIAFPHNLDPFRSLTKVEYGHSLTGASH